MMHYFLLLILLINFDNSNKLNAQTTTNYAYRYLDLNLALKPFISVQPESGKLMKRKPNILSSHFVFSTSEEIIVSESIFNKVVSYVYVIIYARGASKQIVAELPAFVDEEGQVRDLKSGSKLLGFKHTGPQLLRMIVIVPTHLPIVVNIDPQKDILKDDVIRIDLTTKNSKVVSFIAKQANGNNSVVVPPTRPYSANSNIEVLISGDATLQTENFQFGPGLKFCIDSEDTQAILNRVGPENPSAIVSGNFPEDLNFDGLVKYNGSNNDRVFGPLWAFEINKYTSICASY